MSIGEKLKLFIKVKIYLFKDKIFTVCNLYKNRKFFLLDTLFSIIYFFINPFKTAKKFAIKNNLKDIYTFGETSYRTIATICKEVNIVQDDTFLELGSARGKMCFFTSHFIKCKTVGIEWIPIFIKISKFLSKLFCQNLKFVKQDFFKYDFAEYSVIYLMGTCLEDRHIIKLCKKFSKIKKNAKIITISYSLSEYDKSFKTVKEFKVSFPWGNTNAYINIKRG